MGITTGAAGNLRWRDVLENGPSAAAAHFFDVDWTPIKSALHSKILLPILGDQYGRVLERGELVLQFRDGLLHVSYFEHELPVNPKCVPSVLRLSVGPLTASLGADSPQLHEFLSILTSLQNLPAPTVRDPALGAERQREKEVARTRLARLVDESPEILEQINAAIREVNGEPGRADSFNRLHELLEAQSYRLSYWRTASHEINYRRFFDINTLAGLRVEDDEVFAATHQLLIALVREGVVQAVRVDHPDGLFDPARYFKMLQQALGGDIYVLAEKILSGREALPSGWPIAGTTGYNYLNDLNGLFVNAADSRRLRRAYAKLTGRGDPFDDALYESKRVIMATAMASELNVLAYALERIADGNRKSRDFTLDSLRDTITEVVACFPVYRTYVDERGWTPGDRAVVERAIRRALLRNPAMEASLFDFFREVMMPRSPEGTDEARPNDRRDGYPPADEAEAHERLRFAMKIPAVHRPGARQGPRGHGVLSLQPAALAQRGRRRRRSRRPRRQRVPRGEPAPAVDAPLRDGDDSATHDTKLGEDTRARINVISEMADAWSREVGRWMRVNKSQRTIVEGELAPDRNDEYRFYQALVGIFEIDAEARVPADLVARLQAYMIKSVKEAKLHTSWLTPNEEYESAVSVFVERVLTGAGAASFVPTFLPLARRIAGIGMLNGLAQVALKLDLDRAFPTCIRAPSCGTSAWSIRTIGGRSTSRSGSGCSTRSTRSWRSRTRNAPRPPMRSSPAGRMARSRCW